MSDGIRFSRVLLKISGEMLGGESGVGLDTETLDYIAQEIKAVYDLGAQVAIVVGGGNFVRGSAFSETGGINRTVADHMGMMGTIMNGLALQSAIEKAGIATRVQSALDISAVAEPFIRRRAIRHLEKGRVVVFAGGTGNPYFTTDTAAVLRGVEVHADVILKGTRVDGVYTSDPEKNADAVKYDVISFEDVIRKGLNVMDTTAFTLSQENALPIVVFDMNKRGNLLKICQGQNIGTVVDV